MKDLVVVTLLVLSFAALVTAHVATVAGLLARTPRWRAPLALVVPPLAPYWAFTTGMRIRAVLWIASVVVYAVARLLASG